MTIGVREKSVRCDCIGGEHYIHFCAFDKNKEEADSVYVDLLARGKTSLKFRIKEAWKMFRGKNACYDGIILDKAKSEEIIKFLQDFWRDKK